MNSDEELDSAGQHHKDDEEPDDQLICFCYIFPEVFFLEKERSSRVLKRGKDHGDDPCAGYRQVIIRHLFKGTVFLKEEFVAEIDHNAKNGR